ncbi:MAG: pyridoxal phosphate-dependent aminotransferase [Clostridia bacterium]|nr:pyridoxal phosphate-dependent aminotransferase [Clostridia bacterium]
MKYDFDKINDRRNTDSLKYDFAEEHGVPQDALPLWIADMDFRVPNEVISAIQGRAEEGIFGYVAPREDYYKALTNWFLTRHGWKTEGKKYVQACSVVFAICALLRTFTKENDGVIICQPVYYPFESSIKANNRKLVVSELKLKDGKYEVDFKDFENKIVKNKVKAFILCNPHNPVGRVWTKEELTQMGNICLKHGVFVIADEIHCDFAFGTHKHVPFASISKEFAENCAVCTAPTKTFNIAGLQISNVYVESDIRREKLVEELDKVGYCEPNVMGMTACRAAYTYGAEWLDELKEYLAQNIALVREYVGVNVPEVKFIEHEGTYLVWLDFRALGLTDKELEDLIKNKAKLWLDDGYVFGVGGSGFQRINVACPRSVLIAALGRLKAALQGELNAAV